MKRTFLFFALMVFGITNSIKAHASPMHPVVGDSYQVQVVSVKGVSPFCLAIAKGDFEMVKKLIEMGSDVNAYSHEKTPLMYAARYNHLEIAKLLIANGAKIKVRDPRGRTALQYAELSNANEVVSLLKGMKKAKKRG